jgi:hypothetical protein
MVTPTNIHEYLYLQDNNYSIIRDARICARHEASAVIVRAPALLN